MKWSWLEERLKCGQSSNLFLDLCLCFFDNVNFVWNCPNA
jgi:hypothetical protein